MPLRVRPGRRLSRPCGFVRSKWPSRPSESNVVSLWICCGPAVESCGLQRLRNQMRLQASIMPRRPRQQFSAAACPNRGPDPSNFLYVLGPSVQREAAGPHLYRRHRSCLRCADQDRSGLPEAVMVHKLLRCPTGKTHNQRVKLRRQRYSASPKFPTGFARAKHAARLRSCVCRSEMS